MSMINRIDKLNNVIIVHFGSFSNTQPLDFSMDFVVDDDFPDKFDSRVDYIWKKFGKEIEQKIDEYEFAFAQQRMDMQQAMIELGRTIDFVTNKESVKHYRNLKYLYNEIYKR